MVFTWRTCMASRRSTVPTVNEIPAHPVTA
jgi:carbon starvation protein